MAKSVRKPAGKKQQTLAAKKPVQPTPQPNTPARSATTPKPTPSLGKAPTPAKPAPLKYATPKATKIKPPQGEFGATGLYETSGFVFDEFYPHLRGVEGAKKYVEMSSNNPILAACLFAITMIARGVTWRVDPIDKTGPAMEQAQFLESVLFQDTTHTWADFLSQVLTMCRHGYSLFEIVWKVRMGRTGNPRSDSRFQDNKIGIRRLAMRSQLTIWRWLMDVDGETVGYEQVLTSSGNVMTVANPKYRGNQAFQALRTLQNKKVQVDGTIAIPSEKSVHFRTTADKNNPEGMSLMRPCYIAYERIKDLEDVEARLAKRSAGILQMKIPGRYIDPNASDETKAAKATFVQMLEELAQERTGSVLFSSDCDDKGHPEFEMSYVVADRRTTMEVGAIIERYGKQMAMSMLADFIMLGMSAKGGSGSFALSSDKSDMFTTSLGAILDMISDTINEQLVPKIWKYNGLPEKLMPKVAHGQIAKVDLAKLGAFITSLATAGMPMFPDDTLEDAMRDAADLPEKDSTSQAAMLGEKKAEADIAGAQSRLDNPMGPPMVPGMPGAPMPGKPGASPPGGAVPAKPGANQPQGASGAQQQPQKTRPPLALVKRMFSLGPDGKIAGPELRDAQKKSTRANWLAGQADKPEDYDAIVSAHRLARNAWGNVQNVAENKGNKPMAKYAGMMHDAHEEIRDFFNSQKVAA